jgi:galactonate dehydratase
MKIEQIETLACDAGWRNYHFLKLVTDDGVVGWSEFDEAFGPPGLATVIERYAGRLIGETVHDHERLYATLAATARPAPYGLSAEAFGAIENALLDAKAKALGLPVYDLLGGKQRDVVPIYWSHSASWRINHPTLYTPAITDLDGVKQAGEDARKMGFSALKTNMFRHEHGSVRAWMAGFGAPFSPGLNIDKLLVRSIRAHLEALRDGAGPDVEILLDLNFNARTEGFVSIIRALEDFELFWVELDIYNPRALSYIRQQSRHPISSCETLFGVRQFLPYLERRLAVDENRQYRRSVRRKHRAAQLLQPPRYDDEYPFCRGGAQPAHHGT